MESNIEVRNSTGNSKSEFNNLFNTSNRAIYSTQRLNRSLPRKFKTTSIPVRHSYPNYSHGNFVLSFLSPSYGIYVRRRHFSIVFPIRSYNNYYFSVLGFFFSISSHIVDWQPFWTIRAPMMNPISVDL